MAYHKAQYPFSLLYINDLPNTSNILRFLLYADDTNILYTNLDPKSMTDTINKEIPKVTNGLILININKTVAMLFLMRQRNQSRININGDTIRFSTHTISRRQHS